MLVGGSSTALALLTFKGDPLMSTLSANLTRLGLDFSLAFLAAERRADFLLELCKWKEDNYILTNIYIYYLYYTTTVLRQY